MYKIYWTDNDQPCSVDEGELGVALKMAESLRKAGKQFVTMVGQNPDQVGKSGVDAVVNGVLPDGSDYLWKMRRV